jgi:hypothetical protein
VALLAAAYILLMHCIHIVRPAELPSAPRDVSHSEAVRGLTRILSRRDYGPVQLTESQQTAIDTALRACSASKRLPKVLHLPLSVKCSERQP